MKKQTQLFLLAEDERDISLELRYVRPGIVFLDDNVWDGPNPTSVSSLDDCVSPFAYLWDTQLVPELPCLHRKDGKLEGPIAGLVIQVIRCRMRDNVLLSGRIAAGTVNDASSLEKQMRIFISDVWKVFSLKTVDRLVAIDLNTSKVIRNRVPEYRIGMAAAEWANENNMHLLKDRSTLNYFSVGVQVHL